MKNIYGKANNYKTKADRLTILTSYRKNLLKLLKEGYSPFENNEELKKSSRLVILKKDEQNSC